MKTIALISLVGELEEFKELGIVITNFNDINMSRIFYCKVENRPSGVFAWLLHKLTVPKIREQSREDILNEVKAILLTFNVEYCRVRDIKTMNLVQSLQIPSLSVCYREETTTAYGKYKECTYHIIRLFQKTHAKIFESECAYHVGEPWVLDPYQKFLGPPCAFYDAVALMMEEIALGLLQHTG